MLRANRICHKIKAIITGSSKLQTKLFCKARIDNNPTTWYFGFHHSGGIGNIGAIVGSKKDMLLKMEAEDGFEFPKVSPIIANELLLKIISCGWPDAIPVRVQDHIEEPQHRHVCEDYHLTMLPDSISRLPEDASCRKMFLTQPPEKLASFEFHGDRKTITNPKGLTFQDLLDVVGDGYGIGWHGVFFPDAFVITQRDRDRYEAELEEMLENQSG